jgi:uncharacterized protein (TIGR02246 family)
MSVSPAELDSTLTAPAPGLNRRNSIITGLLGAAAVTTLASTAGAAEKEENPELEEVRALLKAHDEAMKEQNLEKVVSLFAKKSAMLGTGPGEVWKGPEEIKDAYEHFFKDFDKGEQGFEYQFKIGGLGADMGWLMASGNIKGKKDGKDFEFPINLSITVTKGSGKWQFAALHFSTFTSPEKK